MIHFRNDYSAGAHPAVLDALIRTNLELTAGYGTDEYCQDAANTIRTICNSPEADVHFLVGGTQTNKTSLGAFLRSFEAVIAADSGHISTHETGSIEHNGHKVIHCASTDGKVTVDMIRAVCASHSSEHMVVPKLVYISNTTEVGTVYSLAELRALRAACDELGLYIYCDGARLGSAMTADGGDTCFADYATVCDAFTIGGTKNGLLFGEALIITNPALKPFFRHYMKQQGAILAKGRLLGVQFKAIFENDLYMDLARHANRLARRINDGLTEMGVSFLAQSPSNQLFPIFTNEVVDLLAQNFTFEYQQPMDENHSCIRFVTGWNSTDEDVDALLETLKKALA